MLSLLLSLILAEVMQSAGIRAFVGKLSMDISSRKSYVEASVQEALSSFESFAEKCFALGAHLPEHKRLVEPVITPRFVPTCSDALLAGLGALADAKSLRVQSHLAESHDQVEWVKRERGIDDIQVFQNVRFSDFISMHRADFHTAQPFDTSNGTSTLYIPQPT